MRVSLNTIKQYTNINVSVDELVKKINEQLGGVEKVIDLGIRYKDATIVKIISAEQHPNADRLRVCIVDDNGACGDVERDENGHVQIVCGAPNAREGIFVVWLPPKSTVPSSFEEKELFVLDSRELRGTMSHGMLASAKELGIGDGHEGILEIDPNEWRPVDVAIAPGTSFAKAYALDDTIIDIENKMFTHRPDLFGQIGVAREIAGIQQKQFISPGWYKNKPDFKDGEGLKLTVTNEASDVVPRFMAVAIKNIIVKPSPLWLQVELVRLGGKSINNIVDVTNYIMLLTAQPTHAYDYDKLNGHSLIARMGKDGPTDDATDVVTLLNGKIYNLDNDDIVIADASVPVGLGGIMGGKFREVDSETKNIVLEVASFDMYKVRKSSMRQGVFTDALTRFNKGQSPLQNPYVLSLLMQSVYDVAGGEQASAVFDEQGTIDKVSEIEVTPDFINKRLGLNLSLDEMAQLLRNIECEVSGGETLHVVAPFWRTDLELPEDIVEEVGRLYGFDKLPRELPRRSVKPAAKNASRELAKIARERLARAGANEVLTYSFVHEKVIQKVGQDPTRAYRLSNALSPDLQYYRLGLTPSLVDKVHMNIKAGFDRFAIFEINKVHFKGEMDKDEPDVPNEDRHVALVVVDSGKQVTSGSPYYMARKYLEQIVDVRHVDFIPLADFDLTTDERGKQLTAPYEPQRSAVIVKDGQIWGVVGEYRQEVKRAFKLPAFVAGFEVHQDVLVGPRVDYKPLSKYPSTDRDICFQVASAVTYDRLVAAVEQALAKHDLETSLVPVDIYQPRGGGTRNITIRISLTSHEKTLTAEEANSIINTVVLSVVNTVGATVV